MHFDIRTAIGALFAAIGVLLVGYGLLGDPSIYQRSLGVNVNLAWGAVMLVVGLVLIVLARVAKPKTDKDDL